MVSIANVQDIEVLREMARLLERENDKLRETILRLTRELSKLRGDDARRVQHELEYLKNLLEKREKALEQPSSAQTETPSGESPSEKKKRHPGHGPRPQPELPIVEEVHALEETERECTVCGGELSPMKDQYEESEEITVVERKWVVTKHRRQKYRCRCNANVVTAPGPLKLQPGGRYSIEFATEVAASKFLDHMPLERQVRTMRREGPRTDSQTLWDQTNVLARHLQPTYDALGQRVVESPVIFADETGWRYLKGKPAQRWCLWGVASSDTSWYSIFDSRSKEAGGELLADYRGIVMADGYGVYEWLRQDGARYQLVNCWAHVNRKFEELEQSFPVETMEIRKLIGRLYEVEKVLPPWDPYAPPAEQEATLSTREELRRERSQPVLKEIHEWMLSQHPLPQSELGKAIRYMGKRWLQLKAYAQDGRIPLDNNAAERALRGPVVGRKNHYGSRSRRGTEVTALFYTLFESAKLSGIEPKSYVLAAARAAVRCPGTVTLPKDLLETEPPEPVEAMAAGS